MAQREPAEEDEPLELTPDMEVDEGADEEADAPEDEEDEPEGDEAEEEPEPEAEPEEEGPPEVGFGDDEPAEGDNSVIRALRERNKQLSRENAEMRNLQPAEPQLDLPPKPTLAESEYDEEAYEARLDAWKERERQIKDARANQAAIAEAANREWQRDLEAYGAKRQALKLPDFEDSADAVKSALSLPQQAVIVKAASDAAAFVYAVGRSEGRLAELAKIQDPIKFAAAVARMEGGVKVVKKRKAPAPDRPASGAAKMPGGPDKQLEKLEADAERTGDRTAIIAHKKKVAERGKAKSKAA